MVKNSKRILIMNPCIPCFNPSKIKRRKNVQFVDEIQIDPFIIRLRKYIVKFTTEQRPRDLGSVSTLLDLYTKGYLTQTDAESYIREMRLYK